MYVYGEKETETGTYLAYSRNMPNTDWDTVRNNIYSRGGCLNTSTIKATSNPLYPPIAQFLTL